MLPPPTDRQTRLIWTALTALATAILLGLTGVLLWGAAWVMNQLSSVLLPLAIAGIIACLLDPVVDFFERRNLSRLRAILLVFMIGTLLLLIILGTVVPQLIHEVGDLIDKMPGYVSKLRDQLNKWLSHSPRGVMVKDFWDAHGDGIGKWAGTWAPVVSAWFFVQLGRVASWFGLFIGLFLVPVYVFYFLVEKRAIQGGWTNYLPIKESKWKDELVFILRAINESLVVFFRSQVLVAMCVGALTAIGFSIVGLNYALLLGFMVGILGIIPYLGIISSIIPALALATVQFGDWRVLLVFVVFLIVQMADGLFISPKIMGGRVGLHPLTIMIAVLIGTSLLGGIAGGILAIPVTAVLRTLMFRYVWRPAPRT